MAKDKGNTGSTYRSKRGGRHNSKNYEQLGEGRSTEGNANGMSVARTDGKWYA